MTADEQLRELYVKIGELREEEERLKKLTGYGESALGIAIYEELKRMGLAR